VREGPGNALETVGSVSSSQTDRLARTAAKDRPALQAGGHQFDPRWWLQSSSPCSRAVWPIDWPASDVKGLVDEPNVWSLENRFGRFRPTRVQIPPPPPHTAGFRTRSGVPARPGRRAAARRTSVWDHLRPPFTGAHWRKTGARTAGTGFGLGESEGSLVPTLWSPSRGLAQQEVERRTVERLGVFVQSSVREMLENH
jgi:hypothetical protein